MAKDLLDPNAFKVFKKWVPLKDKLAILGLPVLYTVLALLALLTPQDWSIAGVGILVGVGIGIWAGSLAWLWKKIKAAPDFETRHGILVWNNGLDITKKMMEQATEFYIQHMVSTKLVKRTALEVMFNGMRVEWAAKPYKIKWFGGKYVKVNGSAKTWVNAMKVVWFGGFHKSAYFHEAMHFTRQNVMGKEADYKHEDKPMWDIIRDMKRGFGKEYEGQ